MKLHLEHNTNAKHELPRISAWHVQSTVYIRWQRPGPPTPEFSNESTVDHGKALADLWLQWWFFIDSTLYECLKCRVGSLSWTVLPRLTHLLSHVDRRSVSIRTTTTSCPSLIPSPQGALKRFHKARGFHPNPTGFPPRVFPPPRGFLSRPIE